MLPKRVSSSTNNSQCPSRGSTDSKTPVKSKKPSREIPPQHVGRLSPVKSTSSKSKVLVAKNRKQPQFDLNGRRIIKGCPQTCPAPVEVYIEV